MDFCIIFVLMLEKEFENQRLPKRERLYLKESIKEVFAQGKSFVAYPLRVIYLIDDKELSARSQILVSVPKKYFKRAVDRNRIKRLVRENYRLNKSDLQRTLAEKGLYGRFVFINVAKDLPSFKQEEKGMRKALARIIKELVE